MCDIASRDPMTFDTFPNVQGKVRKYNYYKYILWDF